MDSNITENTHILTCAILLCLIARLAIQLLVETISLRILKASFYCVLASSIPVDKSDVILIPDRGLLLLLLGNF